MKIKNITRASNISLIRELVISDFKLRYQNSALGYLWSLLRPLMLFGVLYVVFTSVFNVGEGIPYYPQYLLLGIVLWTFFTEATMNGLNSITGRGDLVRKVSIPKYTIVISTTISAFVNFSLNMVVVTAFMVLGDVPFRLTMLGVPVLILQLFIFCLAISFLLGALFVKYRDFSHIWEVALQILFYATPIIYGFDRVPERFAKIVSISPITQIIQDIRVLMITPETVTITDVFGTHYARLIPLSIVVVVSVVGVRYFKNNSHKFAEEL